MFIAVHGVSGAGKSRLLEELRFPMLGTATELSRLRAELSVTSTMDT